MDSKKIGTFLMVMLVICAVLLLMATAQDAPDVPQEDPTQTTAAPTAAGPEEPSEPGGTTEPVRGTEPGETQNVREPVQTEQPQPSDMAQLVERILEQGSPAQTAATRRSYDEGLNRIDGAVGGAEHSAVYDGPHGCLYIGCWQWGLSFREPAGLCPCEFWRNEP